MQNPRGSPPSDRPKKWGVLGENAVREIFLQRPPRNDDGTFQPSVESSRRLAAVHGVSERAIREIWNRKSWANITRPLWTDAEVADALAKRDKSSSPPGCALARLRKVGRPKGSKYRKKQADGGTARSSPSSPPDNASQSLVLDFAKVEEQGEFGDPFHEEWQCTLNGLELTTMLLFSDLAAATLQECDESWLSAFQDSSCIISSRQSAIEEISKHDEDVSADLDMFLQSVYGHDVPEDQWQGIFLDMHY